MEFWPQLTVLVELIESEIRKPKIDPTLGEKVQELTTVLRAMCVFNHVKLPKLVETGTNTERTMRLETLPGIRKLIEPKIRSLPTELMAKPFQVHAKDFKDLQLPDLQAIFDKARLDLQEGGPAGQREEAEKLKIEEDQKKVSQMEISTCIQWKPELEEPEVPEDPEESEGMPESPLQVDLESARSTCLETLWEAYDEPWESIIIHLGNILRHARNYESSYHGFFQEPLDAFMYCLAKKYGTPEDAHRELTQTQTKKEFHLGQALNRLGFSGWVWNRFALILRKPQLKPKDFSCDFENISPRSLGKMSPEIWRRMLVDLKSPEESPGKRSHRHKTGR